MNIASLIPLDTSTDPERSSYGGRRKCWIERERIEPWLYIVALGLSEMGSDLYSPVVGGWLHALLDAWLIYRGSVLCNCDNGKYFLMFSVTPLVRLISMAISPTIFAGVWFYTITEGLILISAFFLTRTVGLSVREMGISLPRNRWVIPFIILSGIISGWIEYHFIHPAPLSTNLQWSAVWLPSLQLLLFTGLVEEIIFRGMIFSLARRFYSPLLTVLITTAGWTVLHIGWHSWLDLGLVFTTGFIWGWMRQYTQSVIPLALAHGMANIMLFIIMPNL